MNELHLIQSTLDLPPSSACDAIPSSAAVQLSGEEYKLWSRAEHMKICSDCCVIKPLEEFYFRNDRQKYTADCIGCRRKRNKLAVVTWKKSHREQHLKSRSGIDFRRYRRRVNDPLWVAKSRRRANDYRKANLVKVAAYTRMKRATDPLCRLASNLRRRLTAALRGKNKSASVLILIGCSMDEFKLHLETQFREGMDWQNMGKGIDKWSIDHMTPCAAYDLRDPDQQKLCFHYTNLRPMWWRENLSKSDLLPDGTRARNLKKRLNASPAVLSKGE